MKETLEEIRSELPLLTPTPDRWAPLAEKHLGIFLADHAVCEQQAALFGLALIGKYPGASELVDAMGALAAEEVQHLRRVAKLLHRRGLEPAPKRRNPWVQGLRQEVERGREPFTKVDRLLVGALIEARSCERFSCLLAHIGDRDLEVKRLLEDLGPAEKRHWQTFHALASRELPPADLEPRWQRWLEHERSLSAGGGVHPTVHG